MSRIDKLSILGIRSFDQRRSEVIEFHAPLTLIVGHNGSGKTTIIECLKYATTGELPPGLKSSGQAFIHDPNLCGEKEVLGQVKLAFRNVEGSKMVLTRSMQVTVKKQGRQFKNLDGTLKVARRGEKEAVSSRVAELNTLVPLTLGVSRSILQNVIFCHQDDALWPLLPSKDLKVKFDEIFEAVKYSKAIENIKILQKNQKASLTTLKVIESNAKEDKDRGARDKKRMNGLVKEIDALKEDIDVARVERDTAEKKKQDFSEKAGKADEIVGTLNGRRIQRETMQNSVNGLLQSLEEMDESDEDLAKMVEQYEERVDQYQEDLVIHKQQYADLCGQIKASRTRISAEERRIGTFEAEKASYERQVEQRDRVVKATARTHNIRGFDLDIDDDQVRKFVSRIEDMARDQNTAYERAKREAQEELRQAQNAVKEISERKSNLHQRKDIARQSIERNYIKIKDKQVEFDRIGVDEGALTRLSANHQDTESRLKKAKSDAGQANWDTKIHDVELEQRDVDEKREKLDDELNEATQYAGATAQLDYAQKERLEQQRGLETMQGAHSDRITFVVGQGWQPASLESTYQQALDSINGRVAEAERQRDGTSREMEQLDFKLNTCRSESKKKNIDLKKARDAVYKGAGCEPEEYTETLRDLEDEQKQLQADADGFKIINEYFEKCLQDARRPNGGCRTCQRAFAKESDKQKMIDVVTREKKRFELGERSVEELQESIKDVERARTVGTDFDTWERLKEKELPILQREEKSLNEKRDKLIGQLEGEDSAIADELAKKRDFDALKTTVGSIVGYFREIEKHETNIAGLTAIQESQGKTLRGVEAIREDMRVLSDEGKDVKNRFSKLMNDREKSKSIVTNLELEVRDVRAKLQAAETSFKEKSKLEQDIEELKGYNTEQRDAVKSIDVDFQSLDPQLAQANARYDDTARRADERTSELQAEKSKLDSSLNKLAVANQEIKAYLDKGGPQQLTTARGQMQDAHAALEELEHKQSDVVRKIKELDDHVSNHSRIKKSMIDNQRYRSDVRTLEHVKKEIEDLESRNAEEDKDFYTRERRKADFEFSTLASKVSAMLATIEAKKTQLDELMKNFDTDYKDASRKYKEAHIRVETTKACIDDLGRYAQALDKAIMKYHSLKMEEINRIIDELWRKTYQGTDVDTILIRSEAATTSAAGRSTYEYKLCMIKQDAEMEMRGRCSAGQKVLASIIVRLALAECFGVNCGLIALDEPTTNLDRDNIQALASSLGEIIKVRRQQRNFQLIVITHDEEFLRQMGCANYADVYYRVSRDDFMKSMITRFNIADII